MTGKPARILIVAGSDSSGGAGSQADIKTVSALGGYAMTAVTAVTAQDTTQVAAIHPIPPEIIAQQMRMALTDIGAEAIKTGMVGNDAAIDAVGDVLDEVAGSGIPIVVDPVMVAQSGAALLNPDAILTLKRRLLLRADLLTPNIPEAEKLSGTHIRDIDDMKRAAEMLMSSGPGAVLVKGGHAVGERLVDVLADDAGLEVFESERIESRNTHGTGCTLASAIATRLGQGRDLRTAVVEARAYLRAALIAAPDFGSGNGPLWHGHLTDN